MVHYLSMGFLLGVSAGLAPGPLSTLVISETMRHDIRAGIRVALAPLITDPPIIILSVLILSGLAGFNIILGIVSLIGGLVVFSMGVKSIRIKPDALDVTEGRPRSLLKGVMVNLLSPHPYLFWLSVGGPAVALAAKNTGAVAAASYLLSFYLMLVGSKVLMAIGTGKFKSFLNGRIYLWVMRFLGLMLCVLALFLFRDGFGLLGLFPIKNGTIIG